MDLFASNMIRKFVLILGTLKSIKYTKFGFQDWVFALCALQCDGLKMELQELQVLYDSSQRERAELEEELQRCKAELEKLSGGAQVRDRHE